VFNVNIRIAKESDRVVVYKMLELYQHDLSDIWDQDLDEHGDYGFMLDRFLHNPSCKTFVFTVDDKYAGCALVDKSVRFPENELWMSQFFVMKKYRGAGVGRVAANHIFDHVRGRWEVGQMAGNMPALKFWTGVIGAYTGNNFTSAEFDNEAWHGTLQIFDNTLVASDKHSA
jgi:predicted acetyltransferase